MSWAVWSIVVYIISKCSASLLVNGPDLCALRMAAGTPRTKRYLKVLIVGIFKGLGAVVAGGNVCCSPSVSSLTTIASSSLSGSVLVATERLIVFPRSLEVPGVVQEVLESLCVDAAAVGSFLAGAWGLLGAVGFWTVGSEAELIAGFGNTAPEVKFR